MERAATAVALSVAVGLVPIARPAAECVDYATYAHWVGSDLRDCTLRRVIQAGTRAYCLDQCGIVGIFETAYPSGPLYLGHIDTPAVARGFDVRGDLVILAGAGPGLVVVDATNPSSPLVLGQVATPGTEGDVALQGSHAYVTSAGVTPGQSGVITVDVSDPTQPIVIDTLITSAGFGSRIVARSGFAYVVSASQFTILDLSTPSSPSVAGTYMLPAALWEIAVDANRAYLTDESQGLFILDMSNPASPALLASHPTLGAAAVAAEGMRIYLARGPMRMLTILDVSNATTPIEVLDLEIVSAWAGPAQSVAVSGTRALLIAGGLVVYDLGTCAIVPASSTLPLAAPGVALSAQGAHTCLALTDGTLRVVDAAIPSQPAIVGSVTLSGVPTDMEQQGERVLVSTAAGLDVVDVSIPSIPQLLGSYPAAGLRAVTSAGTFAVVGTCFDGLRVIDVSDPTAPALVAVIDDTACVNDLAASGDVVLAATHHGTRIIEMSNPEAPVVVGNLGATPTYAASVAARGSLAYSDSRIWEFSNPAAPVELGLLRTPTQAIATEPTQTLVYVLDGTGGAFVFDTRETANPRLVGGIDGSRDINAIGLGSEWICVLRDSMIQLYSLHCTTPSTAAALEPAPMLRISPNPVRGRTSVRFSIQIQTAARLEVFDVAGRRVRDFGTIPASPFSSVTWDGRDSRGRQVANGVYMVRIQSERASRSARVIWAR